MPIATRKKTTRDKARPRRHVKRTNAKKVAGDITRRLSTRLQVLVKRAAERKGLSADDFVIAAVREAATKAIDTRVALYAHEMPDDIAAGLNADDIPARARTFNNEYQPR